MTDTVTSAQHPSRPRRAPRAPRWPRAWPLLGVVAVAVGAFNSAAAGQESGAADPSFVMQYCSDCHSGDEPAAALDLVAPSQVELATNFDRWVKVHDKIQKGIMPPADAPQPAGDERDQFVSQLAARLVEVDRTKIESEGRATQRRLNRHEYENTLRELLSLPWLEVRNFLPEDSEAHGYNKVGDALDVSHVQVARYLAAGEHAVRQAMAPMADRPALHTTRYYAWEQREFWNRVGGPKNRRTYRLLGWDLQPELVAPLFSPADPESEAVAIVVSTYEPTEIRFGEFRAPVSGRYRLKFCAYSIWMDPTFSRVSRGHRSEPILIYADTPPSNLRKLGAFDVGIEPTVREIDADLLAGETIRPDAARLFRSRPPDFLNPLQELDGMPGVAFRWMEVTGPLVDDWPPPGHRALFGDLPFVNRPAAPSEAGDARPRRRVRFQPPPGVEVISQHPEADAARLVQNFIARAYRRATTPADAEPFIGIAHKAMASGHSFTEAMIAAYTAILSSPGFLYFDQQPGRLDERALAERLAYFLWNSTPDEQLLSLADAKELGRPEVLDAQVDRLLNDPRSRRFINAFLDYWLDLRLIAGTQPDGELYPEYQLDDLLVDSLLEETRAFFAHLIQADAPVSNLVSSNIAILSERLAIHYGIPGIEGVEMRRVELLADSVRGGLLTQASVLKVTANGTTTSPVKRGAWVMARILGTPPDPPPPSVPAVEPDTRGATTIREQLDKHRHLEACNACHRHIDPAGFALENFDVMGAWQTRYRSLGAGEPVDGVGHNSLLFHYRLGPHVDASGEMPDGQKFQNIRDLRACLLRDPEQLARNLSRQLIIYATGAPILFADRQQIESILDRTRARDYGVRSILHEVVRSNLFQNK